MSAAILSTVRRHRTLLLMGAGLGWLLVLLALVAWWWLPRSAPAFVISYAPMPDMVFRAAIEGDGSVTEAQARLITMGTRVAPFLIDQLHHSSDKARSLALNALGGIKDPRATEPVIALLSDPRENLQSVAINTLAALGDPRAIPPLVQLLQHQTHDVQVMSVLMSLPDTPVADALRPLLTQRQNPLVLTALSGSRDSRIPGWLDSEMRHPEAIETTPKTWPSTWQESAAESLAHNPQAVSSVLLLTALTDASPRVRQAAVTGIGTVIQRAPSPAEERAIIQLLDDPEPEVRNRAAMACNFRGIRAAVPALLRLMDDPDPAARRRATLGFGINLVDATSTAKLVTLLQDVDEQVRVYAVNTVGRLYDKPKGKDVTLIPPLLAKLTDPSARVRKATIGRLGSSNDPQVTVALITMLDDQEPAVVNEAIRVLSRSSRPLSDEQRPRVERAHAAIKNQSP